MAGHEQESPRPHLARGTLAMTVIRIAAIAGSSGRPLADVVEIVLACVIGGALALLLANRTYRPRRTR